MCHVLLEDCLIGVSSLVFFIACQLHVPCLVSLRWTRLILALLGILRDFHRLMRRQVARLSDVRHGSSLAVDGFWNYAIVFSYLLSLEIGIFDCTVLVGLSQSLAELDRILLWFC